MKSVRLTEVHECRHCGYAIVEAENGWLHLRVGYGVQAARSCATCMVAEPAVPIEAKGET